MVDLEKDDGASLEGLGKDRTYNTRGIDPELNLAVETIAAVAKVSREEMVRRLIRIGLDAEKERIPALEKTIEAFRKVRVAQSRGELDPD